MEGDPELIQAARSASGNAHVPYSHFPVGAALRTRAGNVYAGCNVENASYPLSLCAERTAVVTAVAAEGPRMRIERIAIFTAPPRPAAPCGGCRQVLNEFGPEATLVLVGSEETIETSLPELLPLAFGAADLGATSPSPS